MADADLKAKILELLDEHRVMAVATNRPDGWPQVTIVGYAHHDLSLYFAVARSSQKFANIQRDPRVSIAIGSEGPDTLRGLSMAARVFEVADLEEIARLNRLLHQRYPEQGVFAPREASAAILRAVPSIISVIDQSKGPGQPDIVEVGAETIVHRLAPQDRA
jgi:nitroimidazol reductase NimA-like FMN-containing flavoprotein (pyridoxamine 5'-phosphate oxidase superfamily)